MAKKKIKELTVEQKLSTLYKLQTALSQIDEIRTLRGELPLEVQDLEDDIEGLRTRVEKFAAQKDEALSDIEQKRIKISEAEASVARYTEQQDHVRNNREYETLTKEIEFQNLEIQLAQKNIKELYGEIEQIDNDVAKAEEDLKGRESDLKAKREELDDIIAETKQQEEDLRDESKKLSENIEPRLLTAFTRLRENARNGLGIVSVDRDACGGCFNKIPPQKQVDIRMRKKIIVCEYCGRIMIDPELAGVKKADEPKKKKRTIKRRTAK